MTDLLERVRSGLREHADSIDPMPPPTMVPVFVRRRRQRRWLASALAAPVLAAAAVAAIAILVSATALVRLGGPEPALTPAGAALLPRKFTTYSHLTGALSAAPLGRVIASYQYGQGDVPWDKPQSVVLASDRNAYRLVDAAKARGWNGEGAPTLLSGDGTRIAVSDARGAASDIGVVEVNTGQTGIYPIGEPALTTLLAWSPDARYLAFAVRPYPDMGQDSPVYLPRGGRLMVLDTVTRQRRELTGAGLPESVAEAAFSPDGRLLAVQEGGPGLHEAKPAISTDPPTVQWQTQALPGENVHLVDAASGTTVRTVPVPTEYRLAGQQAWSPDSTLLALERDERFNDGIVSSNRPVKSIRFVDATGAALPERIGGDESMLWFLGWRSANRVVLLDAFADFSITESKLDGSAAEVISKVDIQPNDDRHIAFVQLAFALLPGVRIWDPDSVDRGPWPVWFRLLVGAPVVVVLLIAWRRVRAVRSP